MLEFTKKPEQKEMESCHKHSNQPKSFFCETCKKAICRDCTVLDHKEAAGHVIVDVSEADCRHRQTLTGGLKEGRTCLANTQAMIQQLDGEMEMLIAAKQTAEEELEKFIKFAHKKLEERKKELNKIILCQFNAKSGVLFGKQKPLYQVVDLLNDNIMQAEQLMKYGTLSEVTEMNQILMNVTKGAQSNVAHLSFGENYICFDSKTWAEAFENGVQSLGEIQIGGSLPAAVELENKAVKLGQTAEIKVGLFSLHGKTVPFNSSQFTVEITDPKGSKIESVLITNGHEHTLTFRPQMMGLYKVCGKFLGQRLVSIPTHILVNSLNPVLKFGKKGTGKGTFKSICGMAIDQDKCLYVADNGNCSIQKFTADGKFLNEFTTHGLDKMSGYAHVPYAMALKIDRVFVMGMTHGIGKSQGYDSIRIFNLDGLLQHICIPKQEIMRHRVGIDSHGDLLVIQRQSRNLVKLDMDGNVLKNLTMVDDIYGDIHINDDDSIIMTDTVNNSITILNPDGTVKLKFGTSGAGKGELNVPWGVSTDAEYILVADSGNNRVQVFNYNGAFVSIIESSEDRLVKPWELCVAKDGHFYVAYNTGECIGKYKYREIL